MVRAFLDIGEQGLMDIKAEMAARKLDPQRAEAQARAAEESLAEMTEPDSTGDDTDGPLRARG